jgi:biofilm PGA synthesis N-glycosyltransferase PgaC
MNYSIITATKNEGSYIEQTILSVINQSLTPEEWIIMDDASDDNTAAIVALYSGKYSFIKYHKLDAFEPGLKNRGGRIAAIINRAEGLLTIPIELIVKIDGDVSFGTDFCFNMLNEFLVDKTLGVASGHMVENGIAEPIQDRMSGRGACLFIRHNLFLSIGKFYVSKTRGEDDLAYVAARALGWRTQTFDHYFNHLKPIGIRNSRLKNHYETGFYKGAIPYRFTFFIGTVLRDFFIKPYIFGGLFILYGYLVSRCILRYRPFPEFVSKQYRMEQKDHTKKIFRLND